MYFSNFATTIQICGPTVLPGRVGFPAHVSKGLREKYWIYRPTPVLAYNVNKTYVSGWGSTKLQSTALFCHGTDPTADMKKPAMSSLAALAQAALLRFCVGGRFVAACTTWCHSPGTILLLASSLSTAPGGMYMFSHFSRRKLCKHTLASTNVMAAHRCLFGTNRICWQECQTRSQNISWPNSIGS